MKRFLKAGLVLALIGSGVVSQAATELVIATVNNGHMIEMQKLTPFFEKANPDIKRVMIEGNTDSVGSDAYNQKLSERRANSVKTYLTNKGINPGVLDSVGYGESRPVATNDTAEGRAKNRRVEFKVVE